jgi:GTPase SAR1 family protein
MIILRDSAG